MEEHLVGFNCTQCGSKFEPVHSDFFRVEYRDHGIWTTARLCGAKCLRKFVLSPLIESPDRQSLTKRNT